MCRGIHTDVIIDPKTPTANRTCSFHRVLSLQSLLVCRSFFIGRYEWMRTAVGVSKALGRALGGGGWARTGFTAPDYPQMRP